MSDLAKPVQMSSEDVKRRLRDRYQLSDGWITMSEVTPPKTQRRFDLIAIMGWQSRGHEALGFEVKVNRGDWLAELKDPAKAEPLVRLCSRWWIAAPPDIVKVDELPPAWGLLVIYPEQIRAAKQAPQLNPEPWSDAAWRCMMLRLATRESRSPDDLEKARNEGVRIGYEQSELRAKTESERGEKRERELLDVINAAEKATGVRLTSWTNFQALGEAMRMVQGDGRMAVADRLERQHRELRTLAIAMRRAAKSIKAQPKE